MASPSRSLRQIEAGRLRPAERRVHRLDRLARRPLHEVVDGGDRDDDPGARVHREPDVAAVGVEDALHRDLVGREDAHERLPVVRPPERLLEIGGNRPLDPHRGGGEDPAPDRDEHRRERDRAARARVPRDGLLDLGDVLVLPEPVGAQVVRDLDEAVVLARLAPRARHAGEARHRDAAPQPEPRLHEGREGERDRGGVAARVRDELRAGEALAGELGQPVARLREELRGRVVEAVPGTVRGRIGKAERAGEVDDPRPLGEELRREGRRHLGRRGEEDDLGVGALALGERPVAQGAGGAVEREPIPGRLVRPAVGVEGGEADLRVTGEQAGQLEPGVPGGAHDRGRMSMHRHA
jgi:hypothetical protein